MIGEDAESGLTDFGDIEAVDPAVSQLIRHREKRRRERSLPLKERRKKVKEREKARKRSRVMLDIPPEITERLKEIAEEHRCPTSQVASLFLAHALRLYEQGKIDINRYKTPSRSPRYEWNIDLSFLEIS